MRTFILRFLLCCGFIILPSSVLAKTPAWHAHSTLHFNPAVQAAPPGYSPEQIRAAYGIGTAGSGGRGKVIAIVSAYAAPTVAHDLEQFSQTFHLPLLNGLPGRPACTVQTGPHPCFQAIIQTTSTQPSWQLETNLDVQWAHAVAEQADILLVGAASSGLNDFLNAVHTAVANKATVVSMSWGGPEFKEEKTVQTFFAEPGVAYVASAGDQGSGVLFPASLPTVVSVGGTTLHLDGLRYLSETAWKGSGGGVSKYVERPGYQNSLNLSKKTGRAVPDVAYDADPATGVPVYTSVGREGWVEAGGTSAGAPQWAGLLARAQAAGKLATLDWLYRSLGRRTSFHDILSGKNGKCKFLCQAGSGFDTVTGLGTPIATALLGAS